MKKKQKNRHPSPFRHPDRHPPVDGSRFPSFSPPLISCGKKERVVLGALYESSKNSYWFNVKGHSKSLKIPRTTLSDILRRLEIKGLASHPSTGSWGITEQGKQIYDAFYLPQRGDGANGLVCRPDSKDISIFSQHKNKFTLPLLVPYDFSESDIKILNPVDSKKIKVPKSDSLIHILYFEGVTLRINPKSVELWFSEITDVNDSSISLDVFERALNFTENLLELGMIGDTLVLDDAHFAMVNSLLGEVLEKIDNKLSIDLGNGKKLWIDHSKGNNELETNDEDVKERLKDFLYKVLNDDVDFSELKDMKEVLSLLTKLQVLSSKDNISIPKSQQTLNNFNNSFGGSYIG